MPPLKLATYAILPLSSTGRNVWIPSISHLSWGRANKHRPLHFGGATTAVSPRAPGFCLPLGLPATLGVSSHRGIPQRKKALPFSRPLLSELPLSLYSFLTTAWQLSCSSRKGALSTLQRKQRCLMCAAGMALDVFIEANRFWKSLFIFVKTGCQELLSYHPYQRREYPKLCMYLPFNFTILPRGKWGPLEQYGGSTKKGRIKQPHQHNSKLWHYHHTIRRPSLQIFFSKCFYFEQHCIFILFVIVLSDSLVFWHT